MREIKFRAWDKKKKEWLLGYELPSLGGFSMMGEMMMMGEWASILSSYFPDRLNDIVVMQYTGLHDKNGKEIYEGDLIVAEGEKELSVVKYKRCGFYPLAWNVRDWEIVGNIYENPELLTK